MSVNPKTKVFNSQTPVTHDDQVQIHCSQKLLLPAVRGLYKYNYNLGQHSFLKTGGVADVLFLPADTEDLLFFLQHVSKDIPITVIGNMSNCLILDKGIRGVVVSLANLQKIEFFENTVKVEAGVLLSKLIQDCVVREVSCCEWLHMIPGTVGGALFMNAGTSAFEIKNVVDYIDILDINTNEFSRTYANKMCYRNGNISHSHIITSCVLKTKPENSEKLTKILSEVRKARTDTQPIGQLTCGCTFKNPDDTVSQGKKAWQLIQMAGCTEMTVGGASVSRIHSNFIINNGFATASDILTLINDVKIRVFDRTGVLLEEEIKVLGEM